MQISSTGSASVDRGENDDDDDGGSDRSVSQMRFASSHRSASMVGVHSDTSGRTQCATDATLDTSSASLLRWSMPTAVTVMPTPHRPSAFTSSAGTLNEYVTLLPDTSMCVPRHGLWSLDVSTTPEKVPSDTVPASSVSFTPAGVEHMGCSHTRSFLAAGNSMVPVSVSPARYGWFVSTYLLTP